MNGSSVTRAIPEGDEPSGAGAEWFWGSESERGHRFSELSLMSNVSGTHAR